jgi:hypothetical protein
MGFETREGFKYFSRHLIQNINYIVTTIFITLKAKP